MVAVLALAGGIAALDAQAVFYLMPFIAAEFGLADDQVGLIGSAVLIGWAIGGLVIARLSDRSGKRKPFLIGAFLSFALLSGLSALATGFMTLLLARILIGIAEGPVIPVKQAIVMRESHPSRRGLNMGIVQNFGAQLIGTLAGPILLVAVASHAGWRGAFMIAGVPGLLVGLAIWRLLREPEPGPPPETARRSPTPPPSSPHRWLSLLKVRNLALCAVIAMMSVAWFFILLTFVPLFLVRHLHFSPATMSITMSLVGLAGVLSAVLVPAVADRFGRRLAICAFCSIGMIAPLGVLLAGPNPWLIGAMLLLGCQMLGSFPLMMATVPQESTSPGDGATATGLVIAIAQLGGGAAGPIAAGWLAGHTGSQGPMMLAAALAAAATALAFFLQETRPVRIPA